MDDISEEVQQMDAVRTEHIEDGENAMMMMSRKEKRKAMKKQKRKQLRKEAAVKEREEEEARANDPDEKLKEKLREKEEAEIAERVKKEFEERERLWLEAAAAAARRKAEEEENRKKLLEETLQDKEEGKNNCDDGDHEWEYIEDGPAEIIWKDNEIIFKKKRIRVPKRTAYCVPKKEDDNRPTSNPLPPQSAAFTPFTPSLSAQELLESVAQQTPNFGTEQDKAHCPFHLKTGVCRFGNRCNRTHFYPDKSCTLLIKNMYSGPGLVWEQDEGLESDEVVGDDEGQDLVQYLTYPLPNLFARSLGAPLLLSVLQYTDEEIECCFEEFYEDVHTEFLKFGEIVNFKVCRNGSFHLRGNVYVHYKSLESACLAYNSMNGRYFAGKQIICEFIGVTRWKIAICGEYMKSRLKTCSRGTTCNFIHCFRNPGGDYEWADWDNLPPKHWMKKMIALFGHSHDLETPNHMDLENREPQKRTRTSERVHSGSCHSVSEKDESVHHGEHPSISVEQDKLSRRHSSFCHEQDHFGDEGYTSIYHSKRRCSSRKTCYIRSGSVDREVDLNEKEKKAGDNSHEGKRYRKHKRDRSYSQTTKEHKHGKDGSSYYHERYYSHDGSLDCDYDRHYEDVCVVTGLISHPPENALSQTATGDDTTNTSHHGFAECKAKKVASFSSSGDLAGESNKCIKHDLQKHSSNNSDQDVDRRYQKHMVSDQSVSSGESIGYKKDRRNKSKKISLGDSQSSYNNDWSEVKESVVSSRKSSENHRGRRRKSSCNDGTKREHQRKKKPKNDEREDGQEDSASSDPGRRKNRKRSSRETSMERSGGSKRR